MKDKKQYDYRYKFSVIMPIYNLEKYLKEAIESVVNQTIGFKENIQIIFVNDGSIDGSEKICLKYKDKYPDNVVYVNKKNGGVSSARNEGIKYAEGEFINFFDGDDIWDVNSFDKVYSFFQNHYDEIDVVACRLKFFGIRNNSTHPLDYKFKEEKVVDIKNDYPYVQLSASSTFIKQAAIGNIRFNEDMKFAEDARFITEVILNKAMYGIVPTATYNYRKRDDKSSASDSQRNNGKWYDKTIREFHFKIFELSESKFGTVIPYVQYMVMYDLKWRVNKYFETNLPTDEFDKYKNNIITLIKRIDDSIILEQKHLTTAEKVYFLKLKYGPVVESRLSVKRNILIYENIPFDNLRKKKHLNIISINIVNDKLLIYGIHEYGCLGPNFNLVIKDGRGRTLPTDNIDVSIKDKRGFDGTVYNRKQGFKLTVSLKSVNQITFYLKCNGKIVSTIKPFYGKYAKLNTSTDSYYKNGKYIITRVKNRLTILDNTFKNHLTFELRYISRYLFKDKKYYISLLRILGNIKKIISHKKIWIISDRTDLAGDNGEAFFRYVNTIKHKEKIYYVIDKKSNDFRRVKKFGPILKLDSFRYHLNFLCADKIISAHADEWVTNAFLDDWKYVKDLCDFDFVFLQHGITKDDLSTWLHRYNKNIALFITAAKKEYESIVNGKYSYDEKEIRLTGFPRFDRLTNHPTKKIVFLPTWRAQLAEKLMPGTSLRAYSTKFVESDYFKFYNSIINDKRLISVMKKNGYIAEFYNHPAFSLQNKDFLGNETIRVISTSAKYQELFKECTLLITDYSSVAFDFAYMKKPLIYSQFDRESFFKGHTYNEGYFDYEEDGFGPVCYDYEETVNRIINYIDNNCTMEDKYKERVNNFFEYNDKKNCERVYEAILDMERERFSKCNTKTRFTYNVKRAKKKAKKLLKIIVK